MSVLLAFVAYLAAGLILAAAAFYPLHELLSGIPDLPAHKILSRAAMLFALAALPWFLRSLKLADRQSLGYGLPRRRFLTAMAWGWVAGVVTMAIPFFLLIALGVREPKPVPPEVGRILSAALSGLVGGLLIGFIEETFFRGALFSGIRRTGGISLAAVLSALLFASLHFIRPEPLADNAVIGWTSGFDVLFGAFDAYAGTGIWDSFSALFAVGILLALVRAWHGSIAVAVGMHAGWVLVIKVGKTLTRKDPDAPLAFLSGSYDGIIGWLVAGYLAALIGLFLMFWGRNRLRHKA